MNQAAPAIPRAANRRYALALAALLLTCSALVRPKHYGDIQEYMLTTVALANHATPDIRQQDIATVTAIGARQLAPGFEAVGAAMRAGAPLAGDGLLRAHDGYYAMHFFAYPALAVLPFKLLMAAHIDPFRCYLVVNSAAVFVLGLALFRLFGNARHAALGVLAYLLCGGALYWQWTSPETVSATGLLAGLILFCTGAPLAGGLLAGLGAMQNPPLILFCLFAPLLRASLGTDPGLPRTASRRRAAAGLAACAALGLAPILFDLYVFGTPSIIGKLATDASLVTPSRLHSFFVDLNQGMLVGVPALAAALLLRAPRAPALILAALAFAVAMALPSLSAGNWNSGAAGMMRYALWAAMPLLFAFLWLLRRAPRWPVATVALVLAGQALATAHARSYHYLEFSPLAQRVMAAAPGWYNPDPEIFRERSTHQDGLRDPDRVFAWAGKTMYNTASPAAVAQLCGAGRAPAAANSYADAGRGWRYINGPVLCRDKQE